MTRPGVSARIRWLVLAVALIGAPTFTSCGGAPPQLRYYALAVPGERLPATAHGATLAVAPLATDAAYDTERIVYRQSPYRMDYYNYHRWGASPGLLVADYLRQAYARTGLFRAVVSEPDPAADVVLAGRITALDEIDETAERWLAHVAVELSLRDARSGTPLWSSAYERREPMARQSPEGLARALSVALAAIVAESAPAVAEHARRTPDEPAAEAAPAGDGERRP